MKKPSLIIGKKQIILSCLTLMLAVAVYVNYAISKKDIDTVETNELNNVVSYGDTEFVNASASEEKNNKEKENDNNTTDKKDTQQEANTKQNNNIEAELENITSPDDYFAQARLERTASRDESVAMMQSIMGGGDITEDELVTDAIAAVETSKLIESESTIENLIKSQGYKDCIVYLDGENAKVVVQTDGLDAGQAAAIKEAILGEVTIQAENIRIFEVK
ncbi:MAG: SpoIIIAH-like family protein [Ruminococcus sp.]|nr:SpoIIIAH-like family protein [Ruminococcus sp.]